MEVETRAPPGPARPFSEGPSYSPITPERGPTPERHVRRKGAQVDAGQSESKNNSPSNAQSHAQELIAGPVLSLAEKLRLGENAQRSLALDGDVESAKALQQAIPPSLDSLPQNVDILSDGNRVFPHLESFETEEMGTLPPLADDLAYVESAVSAQDSEPNRIRAFAKLEFDDGQFYMNTYAIEIGRDRDAARLAEQRMIQEKDRKESEGKSKDGSNPDLERAQRIQDTGISAAASVVSGGIMHVGDGEDRARKKKKRSKSAGSSSRGLMRRESMHLGGTTDYQALANASLLDRNHARPVDLTNMMPSPDECPLIPIHPPPNYEGGLTGHKGISRKHVRIAYNHERGLFELHVLGRNGCFIDGAHMELGESIALASGTEIQIGGVSMRFVLPNVPDGETGTDLRSDAISYSAMSFDFEDGRGESNGDEQGSESPTTDNEDDRYRELRMAQKAEAALLDDEDEDDDLEEEQEEPNVDVRKQRKPKILLKIGTGNKNKIKASEEEEQQQQPPPKRKVGRPPKNGIMSKREEAELKRKEKEAAKAKAKEKKSKRVTEEGQGTTIKAEIDPQEDGPSSPIDKKKARKKQKAEDTPEDPNGIIESIEKDQSETPVEPQQAQAPKPSKKERPAKPPRSPSPVFNEAELTAEQLAKPSQSYVVLIHEALSNHPEGRMSLPQIYRAIERRYPYYKLRVQTVGWQSSVRHNLSQHPAFVKIERDGKGWMWGLDPNVSIEREKKRRPSPPPMQTPAWNNPGSTNTFNRTFSQNMYAGTNGQMPQNPYAVFPNGHPPPPGRGFPPPNSLPRPPFPGSQQQQQQQQQPNASATYQSPYGTNRSQGQATNESSSNTQPAGQSVPQMPAPYLNQNRAQGAQNQNQNQPGPSQPPRPNQSQASTSPSHGARPGQGVPGASPSGPTPPAQSSVISPPPPNNPYGVPPNVWGAVERFRAALKSAMSSIPDGESMVNQSINKSIGLRAPPDHPYKDFARENSVLAPLKAMLAKFQWPADGMIAYAEGRSPNRPSVAIPGARSSSMASAAASNPAPSQSTSSSNPVRTSSVSTTPAQPPPLPPQYQAPQQASKERPPQQTPQSNLNQTAAKTAPQVPLNSSTPADSSEGKLPATQSAQEIASSRPQPDNTQDPSLKRPRQSDGNNEGSGTEGAGLDSKTEQPPTKKIAQ